MKEHLGNAVLKGVMFLLAVLLVESPNPARAEYGEVNADSYATFADAVAAIGSAEATLVVSTVEAVTTSMTVPSNITLQFVASGRLDLIPATVTIQGPLVAPLKRIFSGNGAISFQNGYVREVYPQWWGAKGDGVNNDTTALQAAINSTPPNGGLVFIPPGNYSHTGLVGYAGITIKGGNRETTTLTYTGSGDGIVLTADPDWFSVRDIGLYSTGTGNWAIASPSGVNRYVSIHNVEVAGFLKGFQLNGALNVKIDYCRMNGPGGTVAGGIGIQVTLDTSGRGSNKVEIKDCYIQSWELGVDANAGPLEINGSILEANTTAVRNAGLMCVFCPWVSDTPVSANVLDFDLVAPALLTGYGSGSWKIQYLNSTIKDRTVVIPERNDRDANAPGNIGGPAGIKLGKLLVRNDGIVALNGTLQIDGTLQMTGGIQTKTSAYTLSATDNYVEGNTTGGGFNLTLPTASSNIVGKTYIIKKVGGLTTQALGIAAGGGTIDGSTATLNLATNFASRTLLCTTNGIWRVVGGYK